MTLGLLGEIKTPQEVWLLTPHITPCRGISLRSPKLDQLEYPFINVLVISPDFSGLTFRRRTFASRSISVRPRLRLCYLDAISSPCPSISR